MGVLDCIPSHRCTVPCSWLHVHSSLQLAAREMCARELRHRKQRKRMTLDLYGGPQRDRGEVLCSPYAEGPSDSQ
ncbi:hypothetical protein CRUP_033104 [Coryphaenoides rupestris]|nr:hypothetical protein CRUP_033104 [Coryphaenoides rupestris]